MRGWMQSKVGVVALGAASVLLLASCLVGSNKSKSHTTDSTNLPTYSDGHYISMAYESYAVGATFLTPSGGINMKWGQTLLTLPFTSSIRPVLRFVFEEAGATTVQYITQNESGSIFLHGFGGIGTATAGLPNNSYWLDSNGVLQAGDPAPVPRQVFWSPIKDSFTSDGQPIERAKEGALDFDIMGKCDVSACKSLATMKALPYTAPNPPSNPEDISIPGFEITSSVKQTVETPLGNFETYHVRYKGTLFVKQEDSAGSSFDYRTSCLKPGTVGRADYEGEIWIYPPIGPVKIRNRCFPSGYTGAAPISYIAVITGTNIPFD